MLIVISPAKTLDYDSPLPAHEATQPRLLEHSEELVERAQQLSPDDIRQLMKVSDKIAQLNEQRFAEWTTPFTEDNARPAIFAFKGDVYTGLDSEHFSAEDLAAAQRRLRILSGLYGVLRPLDLMQPYRLEMGTRLDNARGRNLYAFWGDLISEQLAADMHTAGTDTLINLASNEYFKAVKPKQLPGPIIEPVFQDEKNGQYKVISFWAKKARGRMAAWILQQNITRAEHLRQFTEDGYRHDPQASSDHKPVFRRPEQ
ncbi:MAG TPA: peroxide stress protein YaaA [Salinisphaeraceae bacterium]|nr:peroxide stress protein YaaA [Salinisphaeraceae bacterium]